MSDDLTCTNCGEYAGSPIADRIAELEAKLRASVMQELASLGQAQDAHQAQLEAEAKLAKAVELLSRAVDMTGDPHCYYDRHGYCQAHNLEPKGECWVEQSQRLIAELTGG